MNVPKRIQADQPLLPDHRERSLHPKIIPPGKPLLYSTSMVKCLLTVVVLLIGFLPRNLFAEIKIERAQREFQARYHLIHRNDALDSQYVRWPDCHCGQAPNFPKDSFYGDIAKDPMLGAKLVADLADKFFTTASIYSYFVNTPDGVENVAGESAIWGYAYTDFTVISPGDVNESNFFEHFKTLEGYINQLKYIGSTEDQTVYGGFPDLDTYSTGVTDPWPSDVESRYGQSGSDPSCTTCGCAISQALSDWESHDWTADGLNIGVSSSVSCNPDTQTNCSAFLVSNRGRIYVDARGYKGGVAPYMCKFQSQPVPSLAKTNQL